MQESGCIQCRLLVRGSDSMGTTRIRRLAGSPAPERGGTIMSQEAGDVKGHRLSIVAGSAFGVGAFTDKEGGTAKTELFEHDCPQR